MAEDARFESGSFYHLEVADDGRSDSIDIQGKALIDGGDVQVRLENSKNLLTESEVKSITGIRYLVLQTGKGIEGQFDSIVPSYPFLTPVLSYSTNALSMTYRRNDTPFGSLAETRNESSVAAAVESLINKQDLDAPADVAPPQTPEDSIQGNVSVTPDTPASVLISTPGSHSEDKSTAASVKAADAAAVKNSPVYESFLYLRTKAEIQHATRQLSGQVHADNLSAQLNNARYFRREIIDRLENRQRNKYPSKAVEEANPDGWVNVIGSWGNSEKTDEFAGFRLTSRGFMLGADAPLSDDSLLGISAGYYRTTLRNDLTSTAQSDTWMAGLYGGKRYGALSLKTGLAYAYHAISTFRSVQYAMQSDRLNADYHAQSGQIFADVGYMYTTPVISIEPFGSLACTRYTSDAFTESGGAAALHGGTYSRNVSLTSTGIRGEKSIALSQSVALNIRATAGILHLFGDLQRGVSLSFADAQSFFRVNSQPASRNAAIIGASATLETGTNKTISLTYDGLHSSGYQDNSVNASINWSF